MIRGITVSADPGEVVSLVGPNGSGSSTLLKSLVGIVRISAGTVTVGGKPVTGLVPEKIARASVGPPTVSAGEARGRPPGAPRGAI